MCVTQTLLKPAQASSSIRSQNAHGFSYSWQSKSNTPRSRETKEDSKKVLRVLVFLYRNGRDPIQW